MNERYEPAVHIAESQRHAGEARTGRDDHGRLMYSQEVAALLAINDALLAIVESLQPKIQERHPGS